jgi:DNA-binding transcriptional MerR regulator
MKVDGEFFTARQVRSFTGVSYETLNYWAKIGLVNPSVSAAHGSGTRRVYDFEDLVAIRVAMRLRAAGIFGQAMIRILNVLHQAGFASPASVGIAITPTGDVVVTEKAGQSYSALHRPGQLLFDFTCDCRSEAAELRRLLDDKAEAAQTLRIDRRPVANESKVTETCKRKRKEKN